MSTAAIVYVLTVLAAVVVVLTRVRLARPAGGAGRFEVGRRLVDVHTVAGVLALVVWTAFLVAGEDSTLGSATAGIIALALWWVVVVAGLLILVRWMPSRGRHANEARRDSWSEGPGLSVLAHVGMFVGVCVFTWAYLTSAV
ncbi:hypothetical protein [Nocardioides panaciterrulae]|uniref:Integral membrane protein n=1 Tax=Nocardioides panaciterrulae TaxID=661492 RepID=A0A7Y9E815_9ACTN|nr:hypothetical protein [Nocardioides panaciterrulae]NYD42813.1 hypothetical protein [Nocardioides panaciterrulae]